MLHPVVDKLPQSSAALAEEVCLISRRVIRVFFLFLSTSFLCVQFVLLDVRGHASVGALQGRILRRRVGTDRWPTGHVLADERTVLGELATF